MSSLLRNIKTMARSGLIKGTSNSASSWVVLPYTELGNINSVQDLKGKARWLHQGHSTLESYPTGALAALPNEAELKYAKWIAQQEDPSGWPLMQVRTQADVANVMVSKGGTAPPSKTEVQDP